MRLVGILLAASLALMAQVASAQDYGRTGLYGTVNGVVGVESFDISGVDFDSSVGVSGRLGSHITPNFSLEGQVEYAGTFDWNMFGESVEVSSTLLAVNGRLYLLTGRVQPYVLGGMGWGFTDLDSSVGISADDSGWVGRVGGGADIYINDQVGITLDAIYNITTGDIEDLNYLSIGWGLFYRF